MDSLISVGDASLNSALLSDVLEERLELFLFVITIDTVTGALKNVSHASVISGTSALPMKSVKTAKVKNWGWYLLLEPLFCLNQVEQTERCFHFRYLISTKQRGLSSKPREMNSLNILHAH